MSPSDRATFEGIAGEQLMELGYEVGEQVEREAQQGCGRAGNLMLGRARNTLTRERHRELGLTDSEYDRIRELPGPRAERSRARHVLADVVEHCAYKTAQPLRRFPTEGEGRWDRARTRRVDVGGGRVAAFKVESHNHPAPWSRSRVPRQGPQRDPRHACAGARLLAVLDSLRFGELDSERLCHLFDRVVADRALRELDRCADRGRGGCTSSPLRAQLPGQRDVRRPAEADRMVRSAAAGPGNAVVILGA